MVFFETVFFWTGYIKKRILHQHQMTSWRKNGWTRAGDDFFRNRVILRSRVILRKTHEYSLIILRIKKPNHGKPIAFSLPQGGERQDGSFFYCKVQGRTRQFCSNSCDLLTPPPPILKGKDQFFIQKSAFFATPPHQFRVTHCLFRHFLGGVNTFSLELLRHPPKCV